MVFNVRSNHRADVDEEAQTLLAQLNATTTQEVKEPYGIEVFDQPAGKAVRIAHVTLPNMGWVAIHELDDAGAMRNALGAILRDAGSHENVIVDLLRGTEPEGRYAAVIYIDDGDKKFSARKDNRLTTADSQLVRDEFTALLPVSPGGR